MNKTKLPYYLPITLSLLLLLLLTVFFLEQAYSLDLALAPLTGSNNADDHGTGFMEQDSIRICCAWAADKLSDGILTYTIVNGGQTEQAATRDAIQEWESRIPNLKFSEVVTPAIEAPVDIQLQYQSLFLVIC